MPAVVDFLVAGEVTLPDTIGPEPREAAVFPATVSAWHMVLILVERDTAKAVILALLPMALMGKTVLLLLFITAARLLPVPARK